MTKENYSDRKIMPFTEEIPDRMDDSYILQLFPVKHGFFSPAKLGARISNPDGTPVTIFGEDKPMGLVRQITSTISLDHYNEFERGRSIILVEPERDKDKTLVDEALGNDLMMTLRNYLGLYNHTQLDHNLG